MRSSPRSFLETARRSLLPITRNKGSVPPGTDLQHLEGLIPSSIDLMRTAFPDPQVRCLMGQLWDFINQGRTPAVLGPVGTVSFLAVGSAALVMFPKNWVEMFRANPCLQLGGLVFAASQAADYCAGRTAANADRTLERARAYEASYLLAVRESLAEAELTEYQKKVLSDFPGGIDSLEGDPAEISRLC